MKRSKFSETQVAPRPPTYVGSLELRTTAIACQLAD